MLCPAARSGQNNLHPTTVSIALGPGETKSWDDVAESLFGLNDVLGAARVRASKPVIVSSRIYNKSDGQTAAGTQGLFYSGIPSDFAIGPGQSATLQGARQDIDFRCNLFLVESSGSSASVRILARDGQGKPVSMLTLDLQPYEQRLVPLTAIVTGDITTALLETSIVGGAGRVIVSGSLIANESQDASGFEMAFRPEILGEGTPGPQGPPVGLGGAAEQHRQPERGPRLQRRQRPGARDRQHIPRHGRRSAGRREPELARTHSSDMPRWAV